MADNFANVLPGIGDPAHDMFLITPDDTTEIAKLPQAVRFDSAGQVTLRASRSTADVVINVVAGEVIAVRPRFIRATGTTAIGIHGLV